jgi:hypothetical protein
MSLASRSCDPVGVDHGVEIDPLGLNGDADRIGTDTSGGAGDVVADVLEIEPRRDLDFVNPDVVELATQVILVDLELDWDIVDLAQLVAELAAEVAGVREDSIL